MSHSSEKPFENAEHSAAQPDLTSDGWQLRYDQGKTGWDRGQPNSILEQWIANKVLTPSRVLIPGCGRGHEVIRLAQLGFDVTGIDFAPSAVRHLQAELLQRNLIATVHQSDVFEFDDEQGFDFIYEQTCLCAIAPARWQEYERKLLQWLRPRGQLLALFMQSGKRTEPPYSCELEEMRTLFSCVNWDWLSAPIRVDHPAGLHEFACRLAKKEQVR
ncbi:MAG: methyltransferase domain-containing protein [Planctomycetes bacterium]|nr:methyltransferase domain-containing protein [Planctomycetota bacterium]